MLEGKDPTIIHKKSNNLTTLYEQGLGECGKEKIPFNSKNQAQWRAAICHDLSGKLNSEFGTKTQTTKTY